MHFDELFAIVKSLTIRKQKQSGNKIYKTPNNLGYLVNKSYKIITKGGHFSDRKLQNGYKNYLGSYTKYNCNIFFKINKKFTNNIFTNIHIYIIIYYIISFLKTRNFHF